MRWPRRGILIRLAIYVPLIAFLAWRAQGGCDNSATMTRDDAMEQKLAPHRKVITLPDGTQQEIVELTAEEAEAILGHPIPRDLDRVGEGKAGASDAKAGGDMKLGDDAAGTGTKAGGDTKVGGESADASTKAGSDVKAGGDTKLGDAKAGGDTKLGDGAAGAGTKAGDTLVNPDATSSSGAKTGDVKAGTATK
jgi:hypothetical protein